MNPKLSIIVATYNHEKYIEYAINSILMQKVNFEYEVLIGEDCSTDNTKYILNKLEKKCGDNFKFIYRESNTYKNQEKYPYGNFGDLKLRAKGEYIIVLEGDDYWTEDDKLQKQVDFLDKHPEYYGCTHQCVVVDEYNNIINKEYATSGEGEYKLRYLASNVMPGQTATFMYRNPFIKYSLEELDFIINPRYYIGDRRNVFFVGTHGKIWCMADKMSAYRFVQNSGSSFTATNKKLFKDEYPHYKSFVSYCKANNIEGKFKRYAEFMLYFFLLKSWIRGKIKYTEFRIYVKEISCPIYCLFFSAVYFIKKGLLKMKIAF